MEEIKEFKEKEARIVAISGGNELVKAAEVADVAEETADGAETLPARKRKISGERRPPAHSAPRSGAQVNSMFK